jgi:hypothetical protein
MLEERIGPEIIEQLRAFVGELAKREYPLVWVGRAGMTPEELLKFQKMNQALPVSIRAEPGEVLSVEGSEGGFQIPEVGGPRLSGLDVVMNLSSEMQEEEEAKLRHAVMHIYAAKQGKVLVQVADEIEWMSKDRITDEDTAWLVGVPGFGIGQDRRTHQPAIIKDLPPIVGIWVGTRTKAVPIDELTAEQVDEDLFKDLERHASGKTIGPFVIPETPGVKAYLTEHGEYYG